MGWDALNAWDPNAKRIKPLTGGAANDVWLALVNNKPVVARLGIRSDADLAWEATLLRHLAANGLTVPTPIPTKDGHLFKNGLTVMPFLEGSPPQDKSDWVRVAKTLRALHTLTQGWPQRPGWRSSGDLLKHTRGTKIDLTAMPAEGVARCRAAWARLDGRDTCVVHGNPTNPNNILVTADRVALIDWDEAHSDVCDLDLALPDNAAGLDDQVYDVASQASAAWEAAVSWGDDYAIRRLAAVRGV